MSTFTSVLGNSHAQPGNIELGLSPVIQFNLAVAGSTNISWILSGFILHVTGSASVSPHIAVSRSIASSIISVTSALLNQHRNRSSSASMEGAGTFVLFEFGGFGVTAAVSLSATEVQVEFDSFLDFTFPQVLSKFNYLIPGLTVNAVYQYTSTSVRLVTSVQSGAHYIVTATAALGIYGQMMDPNPVFHTTTFQGTAPAPTIRGRAVSSTKVRVLYSTQMLNDSNLSNTANYSVTDLSGTPIPIVSATPEQPSNIESVALILSSNLGDTGLYQVSVSPSIHSVGGQSVFPSTSVFEWLAETGPVEIGFDMFTGEVSGGLLGSPDGQVFFSPALDTAVANSVIQVDEVDVCTFAFDTYSFPAALDPQLMFTFQRGRPVGSSALGSSVLWAPFPRLVEARFELSSSGGTPFAHDSMAPIADGVTVIIQEDGGPQQFKVLKEGIFGSSSFVAVPS